MKELENTIVKAFSRGFMIGYDELAEYIYNAGYRKIPDNIGDFSDGYHTFNELYLYHAIRSNDVQYQFSGKVNGATVKNLNSDLVKNTYIKVPPMELQEQFAAFVEQTDKLKLAIQQSLDKLELLKKSLMQEYFG